jgi:hypothetical protein
MPASKKGAKAKAAPVESADTPREDENEWEYGARRREELSSNGQNSTYESVPGSPLVLQHRGNPGGDE